jgi:Ni,Fe-hydrogenase I small subunit
LKPFLNSAANSCNAAGYCAYCLGCTASYFANTCANFIEKWTFL